MRKPIASNTFSGSAIFHDHPFKIAGLRALRVRDRDRSVCIVPSQSSFEFAGSERIRGPET